MDSSKFKKNRVSRQWITDFMRIVHLRFLNWKIKEFQKTMP